MHTRALAVYTGVGRYTAMHSCTHGGLTRSGSMFSRLTFPYLNACKCVRRTILCIIIMCRGRNRSSFLAVNVGISRFCTSLHVCHLDLAVGGLRHSRGPAVGVTCIPHPFSVSEELTWLFSSLQQAEGLPPLLQSKFTRKWNPLYAKQTMRRK